jgi:hypothetical protein
MASLAQRSHGLVTASLGFRFSREGEGYWTLIRAIAKFTIRFVHLRSKLRPSGRFEQSMKCLRGAMRRF